MPELKHSLFQHLHSWAEALNNLMLRAVTLALLAVAANLS
jgi:hypothetical protein